MMSRSVVVQEHPLRRRKMILAACLMVLAALAAGLLIGGFGSLQLQWASLQENRELQGRVVVQAQQLEGLRLWQADNQTRMEVDSAALEIVRLELAAQQETIAELERGIRFYKSLMAPGELAEGLIIRSMDIAPTEHGNIYQFRVLVQQNARKQELVSGVLKVQVLGVIAGEERQFDLSELSQQVPNTDIRLRFKYFQAIDGELMLPEGFFPTMLRVSAVSSGQGQTEVVEQFPWAVQERLSHVGQ